MPGKKNSSRLSVAIAVIIGVGLLTYSNSFTGEFVFDDIVNIVENPSIRNLWSIKDILRAPLGVGIAGRPIINFTMAVNYAISGEEVWSYHLFNFWIHVLATLALFGILRNTFSRETLPERYRSVSTELALACSLVWMVHPLQTQSVTYIIQRCESLMGLFFFLTIYCAIRGWESTNQRSWHLASLLAFFLGIGSKEVIAAAPAMLFLYGILFCRLTPKEEFLRSKWLYAGFIIGMAFLCFQVVGGGGTAVTGPFEVAFTPLQYAMTQCQVIFHYTTLAFWPDGLCLDYNRTIMDTAETLPYVLFISTLVFFSILLVFKRNLLGYAACWFFVVLAPTSSIMPLNEIMAEHRMYLPLAGLVVLAVVAGYEAGRYIFSRCRLSGPRYNNLSRAAGFCLTALVVGILAMLTLKRNADYESEVSIWSDTVKKRPLNARAKNNLGNALSQQGRYLEAVSLFQEAARIQPDFTLARENLAIAFNKMGFALAGQGRYEEAIDRFQEAVNVDPEYFEARSNLALAFKKVNKYENAVSVLRNAGTIYQDNPDFHFFLGNMLLDSGKPQEAIPHYRKVLDLRGSYPEAHNNLGVALSNIGCQQEAIPHFLEELKILPHSGSAHANLGSALAATGQMEEAVRHLMEAVKINPSNESAITNLAITLFETGRRQESRAYFQQALKINPNNPNIRNYLSGREGLERLWETPTGPIY
jgi:tetratricopeptide (TPR) repeat protein